MRPYLLPFLKGRQFSVLVNWDRTRTGATQSSRTPSTNGPCDEILSDPALKNEPF
jgi:hypothetical protein